MLTVNITLYYLKTNERGRYASNSSTFKFITLDPKIHKISLFEGREYKMYYWLLSLNATNTWKHSFILSFNTACLKPTRKDGLILSSSFACHKPTRTVHHNRWPGNNCTSFNNKWTGENSRTA